MRIIYMLGWYSQAWGRGTVLRIVSLGGSQVLIIGLLWHTDTHARRHVETHTYMHGPHSKRVHTGLDHWNKKKNNIFFSFFVAVELYSVCPLHDITPPKTMSSCLTNQELRTRVCPFFFYENGACRCPKGRSVTSSSSTSFCQEKFGIRCWWNSRGAGEKQKPHYRLNRGGNSQPEPQFPFFKPL